MTMTTTSTNKLTVLGMIIQEFIEDESDDEGLYLSRLMKVKRKRNCVKNYDLVILKYNLTEFKSHFRLDKSTVTGLLEEIGPNIYKACLKGGRPSCPEKQLLVTLWFLANQEVYRSVADRFDLPVSTTWEYVQRVVSVLVSLVKNYIKWPTNTYVTSQEFKRRAEIGGVVGAIDGTHFPITTPTYMPNSYLNRNKYHSIVLQAVCDANYVFTDCFTGCPGSIHDARVYKMSPLFKNISNLIDSDHHLLGDSAYPNSVNLITPYKDNGNLTRKKKLFNYYHSSTRVCIEQAFGLLKGRFRILKFVNIYRTEVISNIIIACCILHNICLNNHDIIEAEVEDMSVNECEELQFADDNNCSKRDSICNYLIN